MDISAATPLAAFLAGLATSVHCTAMCGPLACAFRVRPWEYHLTRFISYSMAGVLCGSLGQVVAGALQGETARIVPWVFAAVMIALGLGIEKRLPQPQWASRWLLRARLNRSLGWLTPLIPCGPLWLMLGASAFTGSWWSGGLHMGAFALGTIPLMLLVQTQATRWQAFLPASAMQCVQRGLALLSGAILIWRATLPIHASCH